MWGIRTSELMNPVPQYEVIKIIHTVHDIRPRRDDTPTVHDIRQTRDDTPTVHDIRQTRDDILTVHDIRQWRDDILTVYDIRQTRDDIPAVHDIRQRKDDILTVLMLDKGEIPDSTVRIVVCVFSYCIMPKIMHSFINFSAVPCSKEAVK